MRRGVTPCRYQRNLLCTCSCQPRYPPGALRRRSAQSTHRVFCMRLKQIEDAVNRRRQQNPNARSLTWRVVALNIHRLHAVPVMHVVMLARLPHRAWAGVSQRIILAVKACARFGGAARSVSVGCGVFTHEIRREVARHVGRSASRAFQKGRDEEGLKHRSCTPLC
jgi:hypothetical protein